MAGGFPYGVPVLDTFTGTNGTDLPVYSANWGDCGPPTTPLEIQGNAVAATALGSANMNTWEPSALFSADCFMLHQITVKQINGAVIEQFLRLNLTTFSGYSNKIVAVAGTDFVEFWRYDSGVAVQIGGTVQVPQEYSSGDWFGISMIGAILRLHYKTASGEWMQIGPDVTDATYPAAGGKVAMYIENDLACRLDNFSAGSIPPDRPTGRFNLQQMTDNKDGGKFDELDVRNWFRTSSGLMVPSV